MTANTPTVDKEQARQAAATAKEQAGSVASTAKDEARQVAAHAKEEARNRFHSLQQDAKERANEEASKLAQTLHQTSNQLRSMAGATDQQGLARTLAEEGASAAEQFATRLENGGVDRLVADARSWARRNPGTFLLGALAAGMAVGRLVRNMSDEGSTEGQAPATGYGSQTLYGGRTDGGSTYAALPETPGATDWGSEGVAS